MKKLIFNCDMFDALSGVIQPESWILIEGDKIAEIGNPKQELPSGADIKIDAEGCTLLPGLINLHVHIQRRHLHYRSGGVFRQGAAYIENCPDTKRIIWAVKNAWDELVHGVTTIRDCASKNRINSELRDYIKEGIIGGPTVISCGFGIAGTGGHETHRYQGSVEADGPDEIRKAVRMEIKKGADFIKFMAGAGIGGMPEHEDPDWVELTVDELKAGVEEAHNRGKTCTVHAMGSGAVMNALRAGIDGIEHGTNLTDEALDIMRERGVYYVPTASGIATVAEREAESGTPELARLITERVVTPQTESIRKAHLKGIKIGCGTDTLGDLVREIEILHRCGLTKADSIKTATSAAAEICGKSDRIGTIRPGKFADLLLVRGNPLEDLQCLRNIHTVIKAGDIVTADRIFRLPKERA